MPKISVIVPVYNTETYLKRCLDSIINQTYNDFEIIIINDGSTDNSELIIKDCLKEYPTKISYYKKENTGLSDTRNYGVEKAKGEYICFVDSDDYIDIELFSKLKPEIEKGTELIKYKAIILDSNYNEIDKINGPIFENIRGQEAFNSLFSQDRLLEVACVYLYNRKFYLENKFAFKSGLYHEDFGLVPIILIKAKTVTSLNCYGYYYYQNDNSITRNVDYNKTKKKAWDVLAHYDNMLVDIDKINELEVNTLNKIKQYYTNSIFLTAKELNKQDKKLYIEEIKKRKLIDNIKISNLKQLIKILILKISIGLYISLI